MEYFLQVENELCQMNYIQERLCSTEAKNWQIKSGGLYQYLGSKTWLPELCRNVTSFQIL